MRITKIRHKVDFGITLIGLELDSKHNVIDHSRYIVIKAYKKDTNTLIFHPNEIWRFTGRETQRTVTSQNFIGKENVLHVESCSLIRESGSNFIEELMRKDLYAGIGRTLAEKLWAKYGDRIYDILDSSDRDPLTQILKPDVADSLLLDWSERGLSKQIRWLEMMGIPSKTGNLCVDYYKHKTIIKVESNPYRLIPFNAEWDTVDKIAEERFGIKNDDPRRLMAAVDYAAQMGGSRRTKGHTAFTQTQVKSQLHKILPDDLAEIALKMHSARSLIPLGKFYIPVGFFVQEKYCATRLAQLINTPSPVSFDHRYAQRLDAFEQTLSFALTEEQKVAIKRCTNNNFILITGGAGCGKTTTLVGMIDMLEYAGYDIYQMALSGRAALRMTEASGKEAQTIAGFRTHTEVDSLPDNSCIIIDEASMVSLSDAFSVLRRLPANAKLILIGDPVQLPPIGAGLFFKPLSHLAAFKSYRVELTEVKRQSEASGIPRIANAIRFHKWPSLDSYAGANSGVSIHRAINEDLSAATLEVFLQLTETGDDVRILTPLKGSVRGTEYFNKKIQEVLRCNDAECRMFSHVFGMEIASGYRLHDRVVYLKNDYERGLRNGSLGEVVALYKPDEDEFNLMDVLFDEGLVTISTTDLDNIQLAYALTVHKSQGSQFQRIVIPVVDSVLSDQSLMYTAVTRSVTQAVFVGDEDLARSIIESPSSSSKRQVGIDRLLEAMVKI